MNPVVTNDDHALPIPREFLFVEHQVNKIHGHNMIAAMGVTSIRQSLGRTPREPNYLVPLAGASFRFSNRECFWLRWSVDVLRM